MYAYVPGTGTRTGPGPGQARTGIEYWNRILGFLSALIVSQHTIPLGVQMNGPQSTSINRKTTKRCPKTKPKTSKYG